MRNTTRVTAATACLALALAGSQVIGQGAKSRSQTQQKEMKEYALQNLANSNGQVLAKGQRGGQGKKSGPGDGSGNKNNRPNDGTGYGSNSGRKTGPQDGTGPQCVPGGRNKGGGGGRRGGRN